MKIIGVIPARYGSTRLEGKPLKLIAGKPLLEWVINGAKKCGKISELIVATDDARIARLAEGLHVKAVMTPSSLPSGSDRVWTAVKDIDCDVVVNIQGDEPLLTGRELDVLADAFLGGEGAKVQMATLARPLENQEELINPSVAKIAVNKSGFALYFSRLPIPHSRDLPSKDFVCLKHIGFYAYRKAFLEEFCRQRPVPIELAESLEQLRALWLGTAIKVILTDFNSWSVDTPEDVIRVEKMLRQRENS